VNIAAERTRLWIAVGDNTSDMHFKIVAYSRAFTNICYWPAFDFRPLGSTTSKAEKKHIHIGRVIEDSELLDGFHFRQIADLLAPVVLEGPDRSTSEEWRAGEFLIESVLTPE